MPRVSFKTLGCRLNQAETARLEADFEAAGFTVVPRGQPCDVCVIHGCAVTREAERQSLQAARAAKNAPGKPFVILAGCTAEIRDAATLARARADLLAGQADKKNLAALAAAALGWNTPGRPATAPPTPRYRTVRAWLKVQDGCDFRCAYCIVPDLRGVPVSRPLAEIRDEARRLIEAGARELVVTGANIGLWRENRRRLPDLLETLAGLPGLARLRVGSVELSTVEREVVACLADHPRICAFLHLPLQSGDDRILAAMGRRYTVAQYRTVAQAAAARIPGLGLGTDVIAGFPGEDESAFDGTVRLLEELPFNNLHAFPYSPRPGTPAAEQTGQVPPPVRQARVARLLAWRSQRRADFATSRVGREVEVLIERHDSKGHGIGWTADYIEAHVTPAPPVGTLIHTSPHSTQDGILLSRFLELD